jgi:hypothetical protein
MRNILLTLAATTALLIGGLVATNTAEARPWGYRGRAYYGYGYRPYYNRPYYNYGYRYGAYPGYSGYPGYGGAYFGGPRAGVYVY